MAKQIAFDYEDKHYTLEFNRRAVKAMELAGFDINKSADRMFSTILDLWNGAFEMHHPNTPAAVRDEIYGAMPDKQVLFQRLSEMFSDTLESLMAEPDEENGAKKLTWMANW